MKPINEKTFEESISELRGILYSSIHDGMSDDIPDRIESLYNGLKREYYEFRCKMAHEAQLIEDSGILQIRKPSESINDTNDELR